MALTGRSGSGKSTLLRALARLDDDAEQAGGLEVTDRSSVPFRDSRLLPWERVLDNVMLGPRIPDAEARAAKMLAAVGVPAAI